MFNKQSKISKVGTNNMRSDQGDRHGGAGFTDFIKNVNGLEKWKPQKGPNRIDIIPYNLSKSHPLVINGQAEEGDTLYNLEVYVHKNVGPNGSNYVCLNQFGKRCPLCEESKRLRDIDNKQSTELFAKRRVIYLLHDLQNDKYGWWDTGFKSVQQRLNAQEQFETDENGGKVNVYDWENGRTIRFVGTEKQFNGKNFIEPDGFNFVQRKPLSDEVLSHSVDLSTYLNIPSEETLEKILSGVAVPTSAPTSADDTKFDKEFDSQNEESYSAVDSISQPQQNNKSSACQSCPSGYNWGEADSHDECSSCPTEIWEKCVK